MLKTLSLALALAAPAAAQAPHVHAPGAPVHSHAAPSLDAMGRPVSPHLNAESPLRLPFGSPHGRVEQTIGVTTFSVDYSRPATKGRAVWGGLVPYGEVWRGGANATTTFETTMAVTVQGQPLAAGRYALRFIPTEAAWTAVFSSDPDTWGAEDYDAATDVLRVSVAPRRGAPDQERLGYRFDAVTDSSAALVIAWERLEVPLALAVDVPATVLASMATALAGPLADSPGAYEQASAYALRHGRQTAQALAWALVAHGLRPSPATLGLRAAALAALGSDEATAARTAALALDATEGERDRAAERLDRADPDLALALWRRNAEQNPDSWLAHDRLADALVARGDAAAAADHFEAALRLAPADERHHIEAARAASQL